MQEFLQTFVHISILEKLLNNKVIFGFSALGFVVILHFITWLRKKKYRKIYDKKKQALNTAEEIERESLNYYSRAQSIDILRVASYFIIIIIYIFAFKFDSLSVFAIAIGAIIIILRDQIMSLISYFLLVYKYNIGDDIRVDKTLGEILSIKPLNTNLAGKEDNGEYNGKLLSIPNFIFLREVVEQQELKTLDYRKITLTFIYKQEEYGKPFREWLLDFKKKADEIFPVRNLKSVGNYRSFAGVKYKLNYDYNSDGILVVYLNFISKPGKPALERKEEVINYIEATKVAIVRAERKKEYAK